MSVEDHGSLIPMSDDPEATMNRSSESLPLDMTLAQAQETMDILRELPVSSSDELEFDPSARKQTAFEMKYPFASGGCGEVWEAQQKSLHRLVAVKVIREQIRNATSLNPAARLGIQHSFRVEAVTTAHLEHPNIVPVYDLGVDQNGWPLMAMKLVRGESWEVVLARDFNTMQLDDYFAKHLPIFLSMMQAVAFAHSRGIIHRDLKPSQVMLGEFGEVHLMDWGLAIAAPSNGSGKDSKNLIQFEGLPDGFTASAPGGSPAFMAPEQARDTAEKISELTDVYLLGGTLYKILTSHPPRRAETAKESFLLASEGFVTPLEKAAPGRFIPQELARLTALALSPRPQDRIQSVALFMEGIRDYLSGASNRSAAEEILKTTRKQFRSLETLIGAKRGTTPTSLYNTCSECLSDLERARALWPRNLDIMKLREEVLARYTDTALDQGDLMLARGLAGLSDIPGRRAQLFEQIDLQERAVKRLALNRRIMISAVVLLVSLHIVGSLYYMQMERDAAARIERERDNAEIARKAADEARWLAIAANDATRTLQTTAEREQYFANIENTQVSLARMLAVRVRNLLFEKTPAQLRNWEWGHLLATAHKETLRIQAYDSINRAIYTVDGSQIIAPNRNGSISYWDVATGRFVKSEEYFRGRIISISNSPDGKRMLLTSFDREAIIIDSETGEELLRFSGHTRQLRDGAWSPDGQWLVTTSLDNIVNIRNSSTGDLHKTLTGFNEGTFTCTFSPDSRLLAVGGYDGVASVWEAKSGELVYTLPKQSGTIQGLAFSPDGRLLATSCNDSFVRIFDASTGTPHSSFTNSDRDVVSIAFLNEGKIIATLSNAGLLGLYNWQTGELRASALNDAPAYMITPSPNGDNFLVATRSDCRIYSMKSLLYDHPNLSILPTNPSFAKPDDLIEVFGLTPGREPKWAQRERIWNTAEGRTFKDVDGRIVAFQSRYTTFSPDGAYRFDIDPESLFGIARNSSTGEVVYTHPKVKLVTGIFSPDGKRMAVVDPRDQITIVSTATWKPQRTLVMDPEKKITVALKLYIIAWAKFTPDSKSLIVPYLNERLIGWEVESGNVQFEVENIRGMGVSVNFNRLGSRFLVAGNDHRATMWETVTGRMVGEFMGHTAWLSGASFSPDGTRVISFARDHTLRLWEAETGREIMTLYECPPGKTMVAANFTGDGRSIVIALEDGTVEVLRSFPWDKKTYQTGDAEMAFSDRVELVRRRRNLGNHITAEDVLRHPVE